MNKKQSILLGLLIIGGSLLITHNPFSQILKRETQKTPASELSIPKGLDFINSETWTIIAHDPSSDMLKTNPLQWIEKTEQELWNELEKLGVTKDLYNQREAAYRAEYNKTHKQSPAIIQHLEQSTINLIKTVLQDFSIDPQEISLSGITVKTPMVADDFSININENMVKDMSHAAQLFTAAHETQHIRFKDHSTNRIIKQLLDEKCSNKKLKEKILQRLCRFKEARADICAISENPEYAQGLIEFMEYMLKLQGENGTSTHPMKKTRIALGKKILHMNELA